jgi:hypothetical protein
MRAARWIVAPRTSRMRSSAITASASSAAVMRAPAALISFFSRVVFTAASMLSVFADALNQVVILV